MPTGSPRVSHPGGGRGRIRAEIIASWRRSQASGVLRERLEVGRAEVDLDKALIRAAAPVVRGMAGPLVGSTTLLALADVDGTLLWRWESDASVAEVATRLAFAPGAKLAETAAGTNGIGLALANRRPSAVVGDEHYKAAWRDWACVAAPIVHPVDRQVRGVLNVTCLARDANQFLHVALRSLVDGVQSSLYTAAQPRQRRLLEASRRYRAAAAGPVVALDGEIMITDDDAAHLHLDRAAVWEVLQAYGPRADVVTIRDGLLARVHALTHGSFDDGAVLVLETVGDPAAHADRGHLQRIEAALIRRLLIECDGNKSEVANRLGISRGTLYQRLRHYDMG